VYFTRDITSEDKKLASSRKGDALKEKRKMDRRQIEQALKEKKKENDAKRQASEMKQRQRFTRYDSVD